MLHQSLFRPYLAAVLSGRQFKIRYKTEISAKSLVMSNIVALSL